MVCWIANNTRLFRANCFPTDRVILNWNRCSHIHWPIYLLHWNMNQKTEIRSYINALGLICLFVCHYWQWPILINCVMCYYLCVLRWLMRPILALNCLLQIEQERSEEESSVGDALALAFRCARFCSASLILFASYSPAPLLWGLASLYDLVQSVPMTLLVCWSL